MRYYSSVDKSDRPLTPMEILLALAWSKNIMFEPNEPKTKEGEQK